MAVKLYPPQIEGILPAFYKNYSKESGELKNAAITIPFGMNRAVSIDEVYKIALRIKTVSTNTIVDVRYCDSFDKTELIAYFTIPKDIAINFNEGQFYKAQIAFVNRNELDGTEVIGYYSTVGTLKCVAKPKVTIAGYDQMKINTFIQEFIGEYQQNTDFGDSTEKVETYEFNLWDNTNTLVLSSGVLLHNSADDVSSSSSTDIFKINNEINQNELYYIQYTVTTLNNLTISSPLYKVMQGHSVDIQYPLKLHGKNNYEDGYIELQLEGELTENNTERLCTGTFLITRGSEIDDYFEWNEIVKFNMEGKTPSSYVFRDFTVEQGIRYKYRIQQYNQFELYSNPVYLTYPKTTTIIDNNTGKIKETIVEDIEYSILADFEDMFIYDGKRQLKVKFNPKVSSFKNTIPEQKIETIGSKYPFIFRSGHVNYKEFPVSGLVSFTMDDAMLFLTQQELIEAKVMEPTYSRKSSGYEELINSTIGDLYKIGHEINTNFINNTEVSPAGTVIEKPMQKNWQKGRELEFSSSFSDLTMRINKDLTTENLMSERYFKLKVLDWLTDGSVKLFRSPGEGNYLVRILNVSMTPTDQLGRMLHTFSGTCYEIDKLTYNNLIHYGIVSEDLFTLTEMHWGSIDINAFINSKNNPWHDFIIDDTTNPPITLLQDDWHGYYLLPLQSQTVLGFECIDCAPGDKLWITYAGASDDTYIMIGDTGAYSYLFDDRVIEKIAFMPNPNFNDFHEFTRIINYYYEGIQNRKFDTIQNIYSTTELSHQYVGPYDNLFENYLLYTYQDEERIRLIEEGRQLVNKVNANNIEWINWNSSFDEEDQELFLEIAEINNFSDFIILSQDEKISILNNYAEALNQKVKEEKDLLNKLPLINITEDNEQYKETDEFKDVINQLKRHPNILLAENNGGNTVKFDTIQVEILQAIKRPLIPVYAIGNFDIENPNAVKFALTPFGTGYVNYNIIYQPFEEYYEIAEEYIEGIKYYILNSETNEYQEQEEITAENFDVEDHSDYYILTKPYDQIQTVSSDVLQHIIDENKLYIHQYDIENIDFKMADDTYNTPFGVFDMYQVFIPIKSNNSNIIDSWQATNYYYDTYNKVWTDHYDPTFSINDINENKKILIPILRNDYGQIIDTETLPYAIPIILLNDTSAETIAEAEESIIFYLSRVVIDGVRKDRSQYYHYSDPPARKYQIVDYSSFNSASRIDLSDINEITVTRLGKVDKLRIGNGVVINLTFQLQIVDYAIENDNPIVKGNKSDYLSKKNNYNQKLIDYFGIQTNTTQIELEQEIDNIIEDILQLATNIDRNYIDKETGELIIPVDSNNVPIITGSDDSNYQEIITSAEAAKQEALEAKPLKQQLVFMARDCFNAMLRGWGNDNNKHYGLLYLHPFEFGELPDLNNIAEIGGPRRNWDYPSIGRGNRDYLLDIPYTLDTDTDIRISWWPNRRVESTYMIENENDVWWNALIYGSDAEEIVDDNSYSLFMPIKLSDITVPIDTDMQNIFNSILCRIDKTSFTTDDFEFYDSWSIFDESATELLKRYTYNNETVVIKNLSERLKNLYTLSDFINEHQFTINMFEQFFGITSDLTIPKIQQLLTSLQERYMDLLYLLAHSPNKNENTIYNFYLASKNILVEQNLLEDDWAEYLLAPELIANLWLPELLLENKIDDFTSNMLKNFIQIDYIPYTENQIELSAIYYIKKGDDDYNQIFPVSQNTLYDKETKTTYTYNLNSHTININGTNYQILKQAPVYVDNIIQPRQQNGAELEQKEISLDDTGINISSAPNTENYIINNLMTQYLGEKSFFADKVGRFVEAKDDMNILLSNIIKNYIIQYYKINLSANLLRDEARAIPANIGDYTVEKYLEYLTNEINKLQTSVNTWQLVYDETDKVLKDPQSNLDAEKRAELESLRSTAKYNLQMKSMDLSTIREQYETFIKPTTGQNSPYEQYQKILNKYNTASEGILSTVKNNFTHYFNMYREKRNIYLMFVTLIKDILLKGAEDYDEIKNIGFDPYLYTKYSANSILEYIQEYINRLSSDQQLAYIGDGTEENPGYKIDLLNNGSSIITVPMGYFELSKLLTSLEYTNAESNFNLADYRDIINLYQNEVIALQNRYQEMVNDITEIATIYKSRNSFANNLDLIIEKYTALIEEGKVELRKLVNKLYKLRNNLSIISDENAPNSNEVNEIWIALAKYLLCLEKYYIQEVERRYES